MLHECVVRSSSAGRDGAVCLGFDRDSREGHRKAPKNLFEETDFYTIRRPDGTRDLGLEQVLGRLETEFVSVRQKLSGHKKITKAELVSLLAFVAAMSSRTKAQRDFHRGQWQRLADMMESMNRQWEASTAEQRRAMAGLSLHTGRSRQPTVSLEDAKSVVDNPMEHLLVPMITILLRILVQMRVAVLETNDSLGFITGDCPVVVCDPEIHKLPPMYRNPTPLTQRAEVTMPISPEQLLLLSWQHVTGFIQVPPEMVDEFNRRTRFHAHKQYIVRCKETKPVWFEPGEEPEDSWEKTSAR